MYILNRTAELDVITMINLYIVIGIIITLMVYEYLVKALVKTVEDNAYLYSSMSSNDIEKLINYLPLLVIIIWPITVTSFIIGFIEGIVEVIIDALK